MVVAPASSCTLVPSDDDVQDLLFHLRYNCASDVYERISSASTRRNTGWQNMSYEIGRMIRFEDRKSMSYYLARPCDQEMSSITWKIDMEGTSVQGKLLEFRAASCVKSTARIVWKVTSGGNTQTIDDEVVQKGCELELVGCTTVTITAELTGGTWMDAQLFRQNIVDTDVYPFEVKLYMEPIAGSVYRLTTLEQKLKLFQLRYCCSTDTYHRKSSGTNVQGLLRGLYQCEAGVRETDEGKVFWTRESSSEQAVYRWRVDLEDSGMCVEKMSIMSKCKTYDTGKVMWKISADDKSVTHTGEHLYKARYINMKRCKTVVIEALLCGGSGPTAWRQAQIFRQRNNAQEPVFDVKLFLAESS